MSWTFRNNWVDGQVPSGADLNKIRYDLEHWGGNVDAGGCALASVSTLGAQFIGATNTAASAQNLGSLFQTNLPTDTLGSLVWFGKSFAPNQAISVGFRPRATPANSELVFSTYGGGESLIITASGVTKVMGVAQCLGNDGAGHGLVVQVAGAGPVGSYGPDRIDCNATFSVLPGTSSNLVLCGGGGSVGIGATPTAKLHVAGLNTHASNAAAISAGKTAGAFYTDGAGAVKVVF